MNGELYFFAYLKINQVLERFYLIYLPLSFFLSLKIIAAVVSETLSFRVTTSNYTSRGIIAR